LPLDAEPLVISNAGAVLCDDAALVAAVAASWYVYNSEYAKTQKRKSQWLIDGRRALLTNKPAREVWRRAR